MLGTVYYATENAEEGRKRNAETQRAQREEWVRAAWAGVAWHGDEEWAGYAEGGNLVWRVGLWWRRKDPVLLWGLGAWFAAGVACALLWLEWQLGCTPGSEDPPLHGVGLLAAKERAACRLWELQRAAFSAF
jgi:hypothetical protein